MKTLTVITAAGLAVMSATTASATTWHTKHHHHWRHSEAYTQGYWRGADPTRGPGTYQLHRLQAQGRCVIDEGYGRYSFCDSGF